MDRYTLSITDSKIGKLNFTEAKVYEGITLELTSVLVDKEMYKPGCIKAEIRLAKPDEVTEADCSKIVDQLMNKIVSISGFTSGKNQNGAETTIASRYVIFNIQPRRVYDGGLQTILQLTMYSPDKFLDIREYSKSYTAKCLGSDVLEDALSVVKEKDGTSIPCDYTHQQRMQAKCDDKEVKTYVSKQDGNDVSCIEGVQPYMVQYNETPHNFISRIANRCGEFFYYDDEKLVLGLDTSASQAIKQTPGTSYPNKINVLKSAPVSDKVKKIDSGDIADVTYNEFYPRDEYDTQCSNYTIKYETKDLAKRHVQKGADNKFPCVQTYEGPSIEDLMGYSKEYDAEGPFDSVTKPKTWLQMVFFMLQKDTVPDMLTYVGDNILISALVQSRKNSSSASSYKKRYVSGFEKKGNVHNGKSQIYQFSLAEQYNVALSNVFYQLNKECSQVARNRTITVKLRETSDKVLKLGDFVNVFGCEYVVTKVHYEAQKNVKAKDKDNWFEAVPALVVKENDSYKVRYAPASLPGGTKRTAAPQRAIVKNTSDPLSLGRVRILYPWQPDDKDQASPFIRVAQPYASSKSGIRFTPQVGDEIMVGYEFDDIERPFMMGAIASMNTNGSKVDGNNDIICSPNGHQIKFNNPDNAKGLIEGISPMFKAINNLALPSLINMSYPKAGFGGSMQFTDSLGMYNVELSSDFRRIRIQSHLGNIEMSAMTGISINCPTGDVSIKGKNVSIEAGDKVTITSGKNIGTQRLYSQSKSEHSGWGKVQSTLHSFASGIVSNVVNDIRVKDLLHFNIVDLAALQSVIDGFIKPINGTLLIKSNRFMRIEAGKGKTELPQGVSLYRKEKPEKGIKQSSLSKDEDEDKERKEQNERNIITSLHEVNLWYTTYHNQYFNSVRTKLNAVLNAASALDKGIVYANGGPVDAPIVKAKLGQIIKDDKNLEQSKASWESFIGDLKQRAEKGVNLLEDYENELYVDDNEGIDQDDLVDLDRQRAKQVNGLKKQGNDYLTAALAYNQLTDEDINLCIVMNAQYLDEIKKCHKNVRLEHQNDNFEDEDEDEAGIIEEKMYKEFMYDVIYLFQKKRILSVGNTPKDTSDWILKDKAVDWKSKTKEGVCSVQENWKNFIESINIPSKKGRGSFWKGLKDYSSAAKVFDIFDSAWETNALWQSEQEGLLLISDSNSKAGTISIEKTKETVQWKYAGKTDSIFKTYKESLIKDVKNPKLPDPPVQNNVVQEDNEEDNNIYNDNNLNEKHSKLDISNQSELDILI